MTEVKVNYNMIRNQIQGGVLKGRVISLDIDVDIRNRTICYIPVRNLIRFISQIIILSAISCYSSLAERRYYVTLR